VTSPQEIDPDLKLLLNLLTMLPRMDPEQRSSFWIKYARPILAVGLTINTYVRSSRTGSMPLSRIGPLTTIGSSGLLPIA
jgi:hypothetical protein